MREQLSPAFAEAIADAARPHYRGQVVSLSGVLLEADGLPVAHGELCRIERPRLGPVDAEVVGFRGSRALLMPHGELEGIAPGQRVLALGRPFHASVGDELLGRVLEPPRRRWFLNERSFNNSALVEHSAIRGVRPRVAPLSAHRHPKPRACHRDGGGF